MSQAKFVTCPRCGLHGHIVLADGQTSNELTSQSAALHELQRLAGEDRVSESDILLLTQQIKASSLPIEPSANEDEAFNRLLRSPVGPLLVLALAARLADLPPSEIAKRTGAFPG